ncbi:MAG: tRNA (guanosine(46)-N7)-methyltransferase TrmB [Paludibacteraceae bacterium]|nr:tRNA (guanosine(46)-N7)-methyltransferase TrmB [Paludibacteraceae bacterium]
MGKNKLKKFAEMETFSNVFQCAMREMGEDNPVVAMRGHWHETYFHNNNPIVLELGCGRGEYTVGLARMYPDKNFIGIDIKGARLWAGAKQAEMAGMKNVAFLRTNIEMLPSFFAQDEIAEIWITFPDPQMKKATKRLTSSFFMQRYIQLMTNGGLIHLKTDSPFLYTYTRELLRLNSYQVLADTDDLYHTTDKIENLSEARAMQTHYECQWLDRGLTIKYLCWQLPHLGPFQEPDIDIEKDTYRSYGRNYTSKTN